MDRDKTKDSRIQNEKALQQLTGPLLDPIYSPQNTALINMFTSPTDEITMHKVQHQYCPKLPFSSVLSVLSSLQLIVLVL